MAGWKRRIQMIERSWLLLAADWAQSVATMQPLDAQVRLRNIAREYGWFRTRAFPSVTAGLPRDQ
tara:strand:+ start:611 stop:805 length:195 start_codon:yes stop_codon:yes gene_type:complete